MTELRWECGSEFHFEAFAPGETPARCPWSDTAWFGGSGRDALRALLRFGRRTRGWRRLWFPSYFCQKVLAAALSVGLEVRLYPDSPFQGPPVALDLPFTAGDVIFISNCFGLRAESWLAAAPRGVELIEDHSHDLGSPWALQSTAEWCIASLRKTLPVSDGGVIWSPRGHRLPPDAPVTRERQAAAAGKLSAMALKALYLAGHPIDKQLYRKLSEEAERHIAAGRVSGMTAFVREILNALPLERWRRARRRNYAVLRQALLSLVRCRLVTPDNNNDEGCPLSAILLCDMATDRERLRAALLAHDIYPAILWPLESPLLHGVPYAQRSQAERMLSISCDQRYSAADMDRVAACVQATMNASQIHTVMTGVISGQ
jgi:hypothetical protein